MKRRSKIHASPRLQLASRMIARLSMFDASIIVLPPRICKTRLGMWFCFGLTRFVGIENLTHSQVASCVRTGISNAIGQSQSARTAWIGDSVAQEATLSLNSNGSKIRRSENRKWGVLPGSRSRQASPVAPSASNTEYKTGVSDPEALQPQNVISMSPQSSHKARSANATHFSLPTRQNGNSTHAGWNWKVSRSPRASMLSNCRVPTGNKWASEEN